MAPNGPYYSYLQLLFCWFRVTQIMTTLPVPPLARKAHANALLCQFPTECFEHPCPFVVQL